MGNPSASDKEVEDIAKKSGCHDFIMKMEHGYDTVVGSSGSHVSGGERQRISIARAMLKNAPIVILDEATSYIDPENEVIIKQALSKLIKDKTVIIIAHRLSTITDAEQIFLIENGKLVSYGNKGWWDEMLSALKKILDFSGDEKKNVYHSIWVSFLFAIFHMLQISAIYFIVKAIVQKDMSMMPAWIALILLVISIIGRSVTNYFSQLQQCHASYFMVANKRVAIGEMLKKIPMGFFNENNIGEVVGISTTVLEDVENTAAMVMVNTLSGFINTIIFTIMILAFEWRIGFIVAIGCLLYLFVLSKMESKSRSVLPKRQKASAKLVDAILEQIGGMSVIKSFNLTGKGDEKVRGAIENSRKINLDCEKLFTPYTILQNILLDLFSILIIGAGIFFYLNGELSFLNTVMTIIISFLAFSQIKFF